MKPYIEMYRRWTTVPGVQAADIAVLSALYAHAGGDGICTATQGELAEELRQSRAWINAILKTLQEPPVALVAARSRRGYRGFLYELTGAADGISGTSCQPADSGGLPADSPKGTGNPESSSFHGRGAGMSDEALPTDWAPTAEDIAWAGVERPDVDPAGVTAKFVAWCRKAHGRNGYLPADPSAAWRRWIARELVAPATPPSSPRRDARHERRFHRPADASAALPPVTGPAHLHRGAERNGAGLAARNRDTLAALRARLAGPA
ncbi:hypothetical protein J2847_006125 [Azospirillum agricola]|uniref:MarR family transcriptional regulator n=1 Tax=Azospirillum agricola TaxID=1720247 RepID=UPI001AE448CC|nr:helix-turn-helix domain-containing protein [Azospirillum agricola]MBP2232791.1 hypothetical protein [Azospirillum agricola]